MRHALGRWARPAVLVFLASGCGHRVVTAPPQLLSVHLRATSADGSGDDFVFVEPLGADARVRVVRVARASPLCLGTVVEAAEEVVRSTTVQALAQAPVCSLTPRQVSSAAAAAPFRGSLVDFVGSFEAVIADCDGTTREFVRRMPPIVDDEALAQQAPPVAALWQMHRRLKARLIDASVVPDAAATGVQARRAELGTALIPDLLAGRYAEYMRRAQLADYRGPASRTPVVVELLDQGTLPLVRYAAPRMPMIAQSLNHFGDVQLELRLDAGTGHVIDATAISGPGLLRRPAEDAARRWEFTPGAMPGNRVSVIVRFRLQCGQP